MLDLMENMLTLDAEERSSVLDCQQHEAFVTDRLLWQQRRHRSGRSGNRGSAKSRAKSSLGVAAAVKGDGIEQHEQDLDTGPSRLGAVSTVFDDRRRGGGGGGEDEKKNRLLTDRTANAENAIAMTTPTTPPTTFGKCEYRYHREKESERDCEAERAPSRVQEQEPTGPRVWGEGHVGIERPSLPPVDSAWTKDDFRKQSAGSTRHARRESREYDTSNHNHMGPSKNPHFFRHSVAANRADGSQQPATSAAPSDIKSTFTTKFSLDGSSTPRGKDKKT